MQNPDILGMTESRPLNVLEVFAFAYFPPCVIIGPQFGYKRFNNFLDKKFEGTQNMQHGLKRFLTGITYLGIYQFLSFVVPADHFLTEGFVNSNFFYKLLMVSIWGRCTLYKYISCWILSEGAATCCGKSWTIIVILKYLILSNFSGLTFVSRDEKTKVEDWSGIIDQFHCDFYEWQTFSYQVVRT